MTHGTENRDDTARKAFTDATRDLVRAGFTQEDARRSAQTLLAFSLEKVGLQLLLDFDRLISPAEKSRYQDAVRRLASHEPMAYITRWQDFGYLEIQVAPGVLIPRTDTLILVEAALSRLDKDRETRVLELGCGSGAVMTALLSARPQAQGLAIDVDPLALEVTQANLARLGLADRARLEQGSWFEKISAEEKFDLIVSNPPYLTTKEMANVDESVKKEPAMALWGGCDGLDAYRAILPPAYGALREGAWCLVEIGWKQGSAVKGMFDSLGYAHTEIHQDAGARDRVVAGCRT